MSEEDVELLPDDLVWGEGGHLSEVARTAVADGQAAILPETALLHAAECPTCFLAVGEAAILASRVDAWVAAHPEPEAVKIPWLAVAAAMLLAILGALPTLLRVPRLLASVALMAKHLLPVVMRAAITLPPILSYASAALLLCVGVAVMRKKIPVVNERSV